eukprot:5222692-Pyramimonas_sp.AAC.1
MAERPPEWEAILWAYSRRGGIRPDGLLMRRPGHQRWMGELAGWDAPYRPGRRAGRRLPVWEVERREPEPPALPARPPGSWH